MPFSLDHLKDDSNYPTAKDKRRRGYDFEDYLYGHLALEENLSTHKPYKKEGEQIDGGVLLDGHWYLIECKWHGKELPVSEVYSFKGKVDGKLSGTIGFFISWSGYSAECVDALTAGKSLNVILCDSYDILKGDKDGWTEVLRNKLKDASILGSVYAPRKMEISAKGRKRKFAKTKLEFYVEGRLDEAVVASFLAMCSPQVAAEIYVCHGKMPAIRMAQTKQKSKDTKRVLIVDSDGNPNLEDELESSALIDEVIAIEPEMEGLFFPDRERPKDFFLAQAESLGIRPMDRPAFRRRLRAIIYGNRGGQYERQAVHG